MSIEAQEFYNGLPEAINGPDQVLDLNQILPNGRSVISHYVEENDAMQIDLLLRNIEREINQKEIAINFSSQNEEGFPLLKLIIDKSKFDIGSISSILESLFKIHTLSENKINWNDAIFHNNGNIMHEFARLGLDDIVAKFIIEKNPNGTYIFDINQENADGNTIMDIYKTRFDNQALHAHELGIPQNPENLMNLINQFRKMGSFEPKKPFTPSTAKLDRENVHNTINETIVPRILEALHAKYPDIKVDLEISDLHNFLSYRCEDLDRTLLEFDRPNSEGLRNEELIIHNLNSLLESGDQEGNITEHNITWNFKFELAHLWKDAKANGNQFGIAATLQEIHSCMWGKIVNLCHIVEDSDQLNLKTPNDPNNKQRLELVLTEAHRQAGNLDTEEEMRELMDKATEESIDLSKLFEEPYQKAIEELPFIWNVAKAKGLEEDLMNTIRNIDSNPYVQLLKISHIAELESKKHPTTFDFSAMHGDENILEKFSRQAYRKIINLNPEIENIKKILQGWVDAQTELKHTPERLLIDGIFNEILIDKALTEKGSSDVLNSKDFEQWQNIVTGIAVSIHYHDPELDDEKVLYDLAHYNIETEKFLAEIDNDNFEEKLAEYNEKYGVLNLNSRDMHGASLASFLLRNLNTRNIPEDTISNLKLLTDSSKVKIDWFLDEFISENDGPQIDKSLSIFFMGSYHVLENEAVILLAKSMLEQKATSSDIDNLAQMHPIPHQIHEIKKILDGYISLEEYISLSNALSFIREIYDDNFEEKLAEYNEKYGVLDLDLRDMEGNSLASFLLRNLSTRNNPEYTTSNLRLLTDSSKVKIDWFLDEFISENDGPQIDKSLSIFLMGSYHVLENEAVILLAKSMLEQKATSSDIDNLAQMHPIPHQIHEIKKILDGYISLEEYISLSNALSFIQEIHDDNFEEKLAEYNEKYGVLDLDLRDMEGHSLSTSLLSRLNPLDTEQAKSLIETLTDNSKININWTARDINIFNFLPLPEGAQFPGILALDIFHEKFHIFLNDDIIPVILDIIGQTENLSNICEILNFFSKPHHKNVLEDILKTGINLEQYQEVKKIEDFISNLVMSDFNFQLEQYIAENGMLDLSKQDLHGNSFLSSLLNRINGSPEFDSILVTLFDNKNIKTDWYLEGNDNKSPLQTLYELMPTPDMKLNALYTACQLGDLSIPDQMKVSMMDFPEGPMHLITLEDMFDSWNFQPNPSF